MGDIIIRLVKMPLSVKAYTLTDTNDDYNVYVNDALDTTQQKKAVEHEMRHIQADHFYRPTTAARDEAEAESTTPAQQPNHNSQPPPVKVWPRQVKPHPQAENIKKARVQANISTKQAARLAGVRHSTYLEREKGIRPLTTLQEKALLTALGVV